MTARTQPQNTYPEPQEIRRRLVLPKVLLVVASVVVVAIGFCAQCFGGVDHGFEKSGNVVIGIVLAGYFLLEKLEFRTGVPGWTFDAAGHVVPRNEMATSIFLLTIAGTLIATFGDWLFKLTAALGN